MPSAITPLRDLLTGARRLKERGVDGPRRNVEESRRRECAQVTGDSKVITSSGGRQGQQPLLLTGDRRGHIPDNRVVRIQEHRNGHRALEQYLPRGDLAVDVVGDRAAKHRLLRLKEVGREEHERGRDGEGRAVLVAQAAVEGQDGVLHEPVGRRVLEVEERALHRALECLVGCVSAGRGQSNGWGLLRRHATGRARGSGICSQLRCG